jgi:general secretion pathway protein K
MQQTNKGSALLTALFIMTLVAIVATAMSVRLQSDIYRTRLIVTYDKLYLASQALTFWAMSELDKKEVSFNKKSDKGFVAIYPKTMESLDKQIQVRGGLYDLQAQFNLNNVLEKKALSGFMNLLIATKTNTETSSKLGLILKNWLTPYDPSESDESVLAYYLKLNPPYYPSNVLMQSRSELRLLQDVSAEQYLALEPFITALPETKTLININTASKQVLMSLGNGLNEEKVNQIISARGSEGIKEFKQINDLMLKIDLPKDQITLESNYFLSQADVSYETFHLRVYTLLKRAKDKNNKISVSVVRVSFNVF